MPGRSPLARGHARLPTDLLRRAYLTVKHHGWRTLLFRFLTAPLRPFGLERGAREFWQARMEARRLRRWYRDNWRPVTVVVPTYGPPDITIDAVRRLRKTMDGSRTRIVVVDDGSPREHQLGLQAVEGAEVVLAEQNAGYAASVNRGIEHAGNGDDVVVLNNDVIGHRVWLEALQHAAYRSDQVGIVGGRLLYPDRRIQSAGSYRNLDHPEWFDHRYRFKPHDHGPARVHADAIAMTGACMYVRRDLLDEIGGFDESFPMAFEDVDYSLRAWETGRCVEYEPLAMLTHLESVSRGMEVGERERVSQERFWSKWGDWFDGRQVRTADGALRVIYVTKGTGVGGGHRDVFEHLNRLKQRGHAVELYALEGQPDWFPLEVQVRSFESFDALERALAEEDAIKVATWWETAPYVWRASVTRGVPVYFVQDIETSYYPTDERLRNRVLATYREEFRYMTISGWNRERLRELGLDAELVPPGLDLETFRPIEVEERDDVVLAVGRGHVLKNLDLTVEAVGALDVPAELWMFGVEPHLGREHGVRYFEGPSDEGVNELFNQAAVFVQTSRHEGFCLPPLEAMATGTAVVCTDADGNRDFCRHEQNCLMVADEPGDVARALRRVLTDPDLRRRLGEEGRRTAADYAWERRIDEVERFLRAVANGARGAVADAAGSSRG